MRGSRQGSAPSCGAPDEEFSAYGLSEGEIADLRRWAQAWSDDINRRLYAESYADDGNDELA